MSLRNTVQQGVTSAFKALGDLVRPATYKSLTGNVTRDLVAGTSTPETNDYTLKRTVFTKFSATENEKDASTLNPDKFLFPARDLPVEPKAADIIVDENNRVWEIVKRLSEPSSAIVVLQVRTSR